MITHSFRVSALALALLWLASSARAQSPFRIGGGGGEQSTVRMAEDPRQRVRREQEALLKRQTELPWTEAEGWATEQRQARERRKVLEAERALLLRAEPPTEAERRLEVVLGEAESPRASPDEPAPGPEASDGGHRDGEGGADAGVSGDPVVAGDLGVAGDPSAAGDAGVGGDGGPSDGSTPDAAPAAPPPPPPILVPVLQYGSQYLAPGVHPEEVRALDRAIDAQRQLERSLATLQRLVNDQAAQLTAGLRRADSLLALLEEQRAPQKSLKTAPPTLREVERLSLEIHLVRIEDALVRARQRPQQEATALPSEINSDTSEEDEPARMLIEPIRAFGASRARQDEWHAETRRTRQRTSRLGPRERYLQELVAPAREARLRLDAEFTQRNLDHHQRKYSEALDSMRVDDSDLTWARESLENSRQLRDEATTKIQEELDAVRGAKARKAPPIELAPQGEAALFTDARLREKRIAYLQEQLAFERSKLLRDEFWLALATHLNTIIDGRRPPPGSLRPYRELIDADGKLPRQLDLDARCDGWRRGRNSIESQQPTPEQVPIKEHLLATFDSLTDLCMREEWVLGTQARLAEIARYHFRRLEWSERGVVWYGWRLLLSLLVIVLLGLGTRGVRRGLTRILGKVAVARAQDDSSATLPQQLKLRAIRLLRTLSIVVYLLGSSLLWAYATLLLSRHLWAVPLEWSHLLGWAVYPIFVVGENPVSAWSLVQVALWVTAGVWAGRLVQGFVSYSVLDQFSIEHGLRDALGTVIRYATILVTLMLGLASVGIGVGALGLLFGVIGIGIGFGLQNIASNFISGFILLFERPIRRGDFVQVGELIGEVQYISARATTIETRDGITVIVPNSEFVTGRVINWTIGRDEQIRTQVRVGVAYGSDIKQVEEALLKCARENPDVLSDPPPTVNLRNFGDSSLDFTMNVWTRNIRRAPNIVSRINRALVQEFADRGIEIPFPQRTLHLAPEAADLLRSHDKPTPPGEPPPVDGDAEKS